MIKIEEVVDRWLVELARAAHSRAPDAASTFFGHATAVEAEIIRIILLTLSFEFSKALLSVALSLGSWNRDVARTITSLRIVTPVIF